MFAARRQRSRPRRHARALSPISSAIARTLCGSVPCSSSPHQRFAGELEQHPLIGGRCRRRAIGAQPTHGLRPRLITRRPRIARSGRTTTFSPVSEASLARSCSIVWPLYLSSLTCFWRIRTTSSSHLLILPSTILARTFSGRSAACSVAIRNLALAVLGRHVVPRSAPADRSRAMCSARVARETAGSRRCGRRSRSRNRPRPVRRASRWSGCRVWTVP